MYEIIALVNLVLLIALWFRLDTLQATLKQLINAKDAANLNQPNDSNDARESQVQKSEVIIGAQVWMAKNLEATTFRNGDPIPQAASDEAWTIAGQNKQPAYCYNGETYGKLYNWYAVNDPRGLAPEGWHISTDAEWTQLSDYLGGKGVGKKMKSTSGWNNKGNGTNESGFNGLPGGDRSYDGTFNGQGNDGFWWNPSESPTGYAYGCGLHHDDVRLIVRVFDNKEKGFSVRCLRD